MSLFREFRLRARHVVGPFLGICIVGYFVYHAFNGDRGLYAWRRLAQKVEDSRQEYARTTAIRLTLEHRVGLLSPSGLDPDMLEERARLMLNYGYDDDLMILIKPGKVPRRPSGRP